MSSLCPCALTHFQKTDTPKYIFEGTVSTESQRASRGVLEHWANRISTGFDVTAPIVSAAALKLFNQNSSAGKALKFPPQLLGDVFADPNLDSGKARLAAAAARVGIEGGALQLWSLGVAALAAVIAGAAMGFLAFVAAGAAGPGRLAVVGPDPVAVGLWMLAEAFVGASLGLLAGGARVPRPQASSASR